MKNKMTVQYDSAVIQQFAYGLYSVSRAASAACMTIGACFGMFIGFAIMGNALEGNPQAFNSFTTLLPFIIGLIFISVVCGWAGRLIGLAMTFKLRLQAQNSLCNVQIEENTRMQVQLLEKLTESKAVQSHSDVVSIKADR